MAQIPNGIAEQLQLIEQAGSIHEQERVLALFTRARSALQQFFDRCEAVRNNYAFGVQALTINPEDLNNLIAEFAKLFLVLLDSGSQEEVLSHASHPTENLTGLADFLPIAEAELTLRKIAMLSLGTIMGSFSGDSRLPDWESQMGEVEHEFDTAVRAWRALSLGLG